MGAKPRRTECYRENLRQLTKAESGRNSLFQGKLHQFLFENWIISSENIPTNRMIPIEQVITRFYIIYMHIKYLVKKGHKFERKHEKVYEGVWEEERKIKMI